MHESLTSQNISCVPLKGHSEPVTCEKSGKDFCKPDSDANQ